MSRLKRLRIARGCEPQDLARKLEIASQWYFDLEGERETWADEISISGLRQLSRELDVSPSTLMNADEKIVATPEEFVILIKNQLLIEAVTAADLSQRVGWDVERLISDPSNVGKLNAVGFREICAALNLDWLRTLDEIKFPA